MIRVLPWGRTERPTNITQLIAAFRSFANTTKNESVKALRRFCRLLWGCQFSFTTSRGFQNHILWRQRHKQVARKAAEIYTRFSPRLLFMLESSSVRRTIRRRPGMRRYNHSCFHSNPPYMFSLSGSINLLLNFSLASRVPVPCFWYLLLPSFTVSSCHASYSERDIVER
jgi:hypothetical protein